MRIYSLNTNGSNPKLLDKATINDAIAISGCN